MRVAHLGKEHSFSACVARKLYDADNEFLGLSSFAMLFEYVRDGKADVAVVPVENSLAGAVDEVLDHLAGTSLWIVGETFYAVRLCLAGCGPLEALRGVYSHPKALQQCSRLFRRWPLIEPLPAQDTATAAADVKERGDPRFAAITSALAARVNGLEILLEEVADCEGNLTRFVLLGSEKAQGELANRCSFVCVLPHRPGTLARALSQLASIGLDITSIESRPIHGRPFEYRFYIDVSYTGAPPSIGELLKEAEEVHILGVYRRMQ